MALLATRRAMTSAIRPLEKEPLCLQTRKKSLNLYGGPQSTIGQSFAAKIGYPVRPPVRKSSFHAVRSGLLFRLTAFEASG